MNMQTAAGALLALAVIVGATGLLVAAMLAIAYLTERSAVSEARAVLRLAAAQRESGDASELEVH